MVVAQKCRVILLIRSTCAADLRAYIRFTVYTVHPAYGVLGWLDRAKVDKAETQPRMPGHMLTSPVRQTQHNASNLGRGLPRMPRLCCSDFVELKRGIITPVSSRQLAIIEQSELENGKRPSHIKGLGNWGGEKVRTLRYASLRRT
jgi:hypothetical protein